MHFSTASSAFLQTGLCTLHIAYFIRKNENPHYLFNLKLKSKIYLHFEKQLYNLHRSHKTIICVVKIDYYLSNIENRNDEIAHQIEFERAAVTMNILHTPCDQH